MHAVALHALRTAQRPIRRRACRTVAGARHPLPHRNFHRSPVAYQVSEDPEAGPAAETGKKDRNPEKQELEPDEAKPEDGTAEEINTSSTEVGTPASKTTKARTGGRLRGVVRQKEPGGLPPVVLPEWFYKNNIKHAGRSEKLGASLAVFGSGAPASGDQEDAEKVKAEVERQSTEISACGLETTAAAKYSVQVDVYREILATLRAGLALRPPKSTTNNTLLRPVTFLQCPKDGGSYFLDTIIETIASKLDADLIRLNAQDLAQIAGPYLDGNLAWSYSSTSLLAYDAHRQAGIMEDYDGELDETPDNVDAADEEDEAPFKRVVDALKRVGVQAGVVGPGGHGKGKIVQQFSHSTEPGLRQRSPPPPSDTWTDIKMANIIDELISAIDTGSSNSKVANDPTESKPRSLIVQIQDYKEMSQIGEGDLVLRKLKAAVNKKWQEGRDIIIVGTSAIEGGPVLSRPDIQFLQSDIIGGEKRTILVPPDRREHQDVAFESDAKARIRNINVRNIEEMVLKLVEGSRNLTPEIDIERDLDSATVFSSELEDAVWTFARVHRTATTILGLLEEPSVIIDGAVFSKALKVLSASDQVKFAWGAAELKQEDEEMAPSPLIETDPVAAEKKKAKDRLKEIRKKCTPHEVKLLSGVVLSSDIRTTFADVRAPKDTVEALKTLTSLSLLRPEAFSYGVLASDKIPGVLLYGPPGTGKTLLAKAVAKESGATVLEVTAADLNDMFVGQGEKNVRAVFKLAKKLSPCVVFIDEADAIFSARGENNRNSHREMINQVGTFRPRKSIDPGGEELPPETLGNIHANLSQKFLREWDGMNDFSAFIMVATNRPFDLDEAVLRRLPRRLLVDLPVEKDREAILKIHLKDEILDDSISLTKLAKDTPFYSGSDLKNLSVAAAMACIREENAAAAQHSGEEAYVYPEKRTLTKAHFDKALEEISASVSEDMSTLTAIRKFDEKYGDRKGRKKKGPGLGFGGTTLEQKDSEAARVRKIAA
ncbi:hypothetical protein QTJ16_003539 [Diplocarpon rosae]|uniref:AAA+ ATPase domain-containing protein n=1 Tax=Diplocarpon rosae TaxID=946125 RepID=A0AAD9WER7_9HELO|nr:hypothetical protein QTJ16_003539 [Diplocarpon rosae]